MVNFVITDNLGVNNTKLKVYKVSCQKECVTLVPTHKKCKYCRINHENLKNETTYWVKKMAQFMGYPFSMEEEHGGVVQKNYRFMQF